MNRRTFVAIVLTLVVGSAIFASVARADENNQATQVTFSQSVEIPGQVLPAGSYLFLVASDGYDRNLVRIFSADRSKLFATLATVDSERKAPARNTMFTLAERSSDQPAALLTWFYPGNSTGHQFVYSKSESAELARDTRQTIRSDSTTSDYAGSN